MLSDDVNKGVAPGYLGGPSEITRVLSMWKREAGEGEPERWQCERHDPPLLTLKMEERGHKPRTAGSL